MERIGDVSYWEVLMRVSVRVEVICLMIFFMLILIIVWFFSVCVDLDRLL